MQHHPATLAQRVQGLDGGHQLHAIVGGLGITAVQGFFVPAGKQHNPPAARARITAAGAVGINLHGRAQRFWWNRMRETRVDGSARPATTLRLLRQDGRTGVSVLTRFCAEIR